MHTRPSGTVSSAAPLSRTIGMVTSPTRRTAAPSTNESSSGSVTGAPARRAAVMLAAPAGSTPITRMLRMPLAEHRRHPGEQPAAADRHHDDVRCPAELVQDLQADGALPGDRAPVVERRHHRRARARGVVGRRGGGLVVGVAVHDQLDVVATQRGDPLALLARRGARHVHAPAHPQPPAGVGDALPVVAGARAHRAGRPLRRAELGEQVVRAAQLVRASYLQVFPLEPHVRTGGVGQPRVGFERCGAGDPVEPGGRRGAFVGEGRR